MRNDTLRVRTATKQDGPELARLRWDFTAEDHADELVEQWDTFERRFVERWEAFYASGRWFVAVAERAVTGRHLLGCAWLETVDRVPRPIEHADQMGYLTNVYVEPASRDEGIGTTLLAAVASEARARGFAKIFVWPSDASVEFYARAGFLPAADVHEMSLE